MREMEPRGGANRGPRVQSTPPPPHDPSDRILVGHLGDWEIRVFDPSGRWHEYFAPRGLLHVQLWNRKHDISLISPSELTCHKYELYHHSFWKFAHRELSQIRKTLDEVCNVALPKEEQLISLEYGWVDTVTAEAKAKAKTKIHSIESHLIKRT